MSKIIKALKQAARYARGDKSQGRSTIIRTMTDEERKRFEESPQFKRIVAKAEREGLKSK
jgi:hypothetical protein